MSQTDTKMIDNILNGISDHFEKGEDGELLLTCPIDRGSMYDIYDGNTDGTYTVIINDEPSDDPSLMNLESVDAAKRRIAELIAAKLAEPDQPAADTKAPESARTIPDDRVHLIWLDEVLEEEVATTPDMIAKHGVPVSPVTGKPLPYLRTEVQHRDCYHCDDTGYADGAKCYDC